MTYLEALDAEIAASWPEQWRKANDPTKRGRSKARNNLRKQYRSAVALASFKAANHAARCGNCAHCKPYRTRRDEHYCELDSDIRGYSLTKLDHVCARWKDRQ